ncbi:hypothetical protein FIBSPDRAFT_861103 [Athelia psychrophila]|uniref:Ferritin-like domain-containing protein n=1 Tax=Athelia psychrophila TaxID=1759441 RepID=A0A166JK92_9AGAM|nr:hypothetical protein FIBSPDRAFT_861103 [Fibularhizoctonia sp. CBS 109695]
MQFTTSFIAFCVAAVVSGSALPAKRANAVTDVQVLNFALTLEHLENTFYAQGLAKHSAADFQNAKLPSWVRGRFEQIMKHESTHVSFLETALGERNYVQPCKYNFGDNSVKDFVDFSGMVETVGTSAYTGAAQLIDDKDYLTAAASILATEARQTAWVNSAVRGGAPWSTSFETPLGVNQIYTIASSVITSCPSGNAKLLPPLTAFPALTLPANTMPGKNVKLAYKPAKGAKTDGEKYVAFISGLTTVFVPLPKSGRVTIPKELYGVVFAMVTNNGTVADDSTTLAGPAYLNFGFGSDGKAEAFAI